MRPTVVFSAVIACVLIPDTRETFAEALAYAFRGGRLDEQLFRITGPNTLRALRVDPAGLRITLEKGRTSGVPVGLCTRFGVRGDFEITMTFEIVRIDQPAGGNGAGASLYIATSAATQDAAGVAWVIRSSGEQIYNAFRATTLPGENRKFAGSPPFPAKTRSGRLRLVRRGAELSCLIAQSHSSSFEELYKVDWSTDDLDIIRFAAENGGSPGLVDVRIKDVALRAETFGAVTRTKRHSSPRTVWWLAGGLIVSAHLVGVWWWRNRYSR